ncbi:MAG: nitrilase-related carbon-nitrogen hydrolase, partial [Haliea sp.]
PGMVIATPIGRIGLYACMDGVINETPRCLALDGAQMIVNSLNSFATDEGSLHVPVRAGENKVFVVAANKIGPLVPEALVEPISSATGIPPKFLDGAGKSQVVAPDGTVLAKAPRDQEAVVFADIDLSQADNKDRPDGTDVFECRRPELYQAIGQNPETQILPDMEGAASVRGAVAQLQNPTALDEAVNKARQVISEGAQLVVIPPLLGEGKLASIEDPRLAALTSADTIAALQEVCGDAYLATAAVLPCADGYQYCSVIIGRDGLVLSQPQIHRSERYRWSQRCSEIVTVKLPFGRVAAVCSDDSFYPEYFRLLALAGVSVATVPLAPLEKWELQTGLLERSAENRINLLVAAQPSSLGTSFSTALQSDFTVMTEWQERPFDGLLSQPICNRSDPVPGVYHSTLYPANAANKMVSLNTDLLTNRPWELAQAITRQS